MNCAAAWMPCQYKDYVLVLLFVKYVSDKYTGDPNALIDVPPGGGFADMVKLKGDKEIGVKINKIIGRLTAERKVRAFWYPPNPCAEIQFGGREYLVMNPAIFRELVPLVHAQ